MRQIKCFVLFCVLTNGTILFGDQHCKEKSAIKLKTKKEATQKLLAMEKKLGDLAAERKRLRKEILAQEKIKGAVPEKLNIALWELINKINDIRGNTFRLDQIVNRGF